MSSPSSVGGELEKRGEWQMVFLCAAEELYHSERIFSHQEKGISVDGESKIHG